MNDSLKHGSTKIIMCCKKLIEECEHMTVHFVFCYSTNLIDLFSFNQIQSLKYRSSFFAPVVH